MGTYATYTSLQILMVGTQFDAATIALCGKLITTAENEINKYISKRYDVSQFATTTAVPPILTSLCETLTEGYMYQRNSRGGKEAMTRGQTFIDQVMENLTEIADYKLDLVNTAGSVINDMSQTAFRVLSTTDRYTSTFDEGSELEWKIDQDKLDDIDGEKD